VFKSLQTLKVQHGRLEQASYRLKERDKVLFQTCIGALKNRNKERAAICANEIVEVRKLIKFLYNVGLAIERVVLRLETIRELSDIVIDLKPALKLLQNVSQELIEVLPDVSFELNKVNETISETLSSTRMTADESIIPVGGKTPGGEEILNEVHAELQQRLAEKLPEPPTATPTVEPEPEAAIEEIVAIAASCSQTASRESVEEGSSDSSQTLLSFKKSEIQEISLKIENPHIEDSLLEYVKRRNGEIDISSCSKDLEASNEEIEKALKNLGSKGKIKIEVR
jgi:division protein CdvB (Snf7/Vps24/ESCRT-III family)